MLAYISMRWIIRQFLFHLTALYLTSLLIPGFIIGKSYDKIALAAGVLAIINVLVKPIVRIFFLPLNIVTLNLFSIVINVGVVYALTRLVNTVKIQDWNFGGFTAYGFVIPSIHFTIVYTYIIVSVVLAAIVSFLNWVVS